MNMEKAGKACPNIVKLAEYMHEMKLDNPRGYFMFTLMLSAVSPLAECGGYGEALEQAKQCLQEGIK